MQRWIAALRSGKYQQGKNWLRTRRGGFCCLGVLCDLAIKDGGAFKWRSAGNVFVLTRQGEVVGDTELPLVVGSWLMGKSHIDAERLLANMNDSGLSGFGAIADYLEKKVLPRIKDGPRG